MEGICKRPTACRLGLACKVRLTQRSSRKSRSRESQLKSRMDFAGGLNPNDEAGFTEGNEDHKGKRFAAGSGADRKCSRTKPPTPGLFVAFVPFCKSTSVF